jgi:hypothetical protein
MTYRQKGGTFGGTFQKLLIDMDECNGRFGVTPEFPQGIYHYYITEAYPYMQRCIKGDGKEARPRPGPGMGGRSPPGMDGPPGGGMRRPPPGG